MNCVPLLHCALRLEPLQPMPRPSPGSQRFTENQFFLAKAVRSKKKRCYLVRSKIDADLEARKKSKPNTYNEERLLQETSEKMFKEVRCQAIQQKHIFLISSFYPEKYDFPRFMETLEEELPDHKRDMFVRCMPAISAQILEKKRKAIKNRIWQVSLISAGVAVIPVPGLSFACDVAIIVGAVIFILDDFGLSWANLEKLSKRYNKDINELRSVIKSPFFNAEINRELIIRLLQSAVVGAGMVVEFALSTVPIIGSLAAGGISFGTTYYMLNNILKEIAADSERVLAKALEGEI
ncbi:interferon-inducible GTPase 5-like [Hyperolius riggenbachi]|uniref:interferon-inducible GTPase 5-like n=1 Tax=Hyperolius riggenbachi TaxID=752182 RepID=UPI0035A2A9F9